MEMTTKANMKFLKTALTSVSYLGEMTKEIALGDSE